VIQVIYLINMISMNHKNHANHKNHSSDNERIGSLFSYFRNSLHQKIEIHFTFFLLFISMLTAFAQPANDSWDKAIPLTEPSKCSADAGYSNINATDEGTFGTAPLWPAGQSGRDVWFKFTASAYDVNITVTGANTGGGTTGGTLQNPLIALYTIESTANSTSFSAQVGSVLQQRVQESQPITKALLQLVKFIISE
jgi:hypothetical protein